MTTSPASPEWLLHALHEAVHGASRQCIDSLDDCREEHGLCWRQTRDVIPVFVEHLRANAKGCRRARSVTTDERVERDLSTAQYAFARLADMIEEATPR